MKHILLAATAALVVIGHARDVAAAPAPSSLPAFEKGRAALEAAHAELAQLRARITEERVPLAASLREIESELLARRREAERLQRLADNQTIDLRNLETEQKLRADEIDYIETLLTDYASRLNATIDAGEIQLYSDRLNEILNLESDSGTPRAEILKAKLEALHLGLNRIRERLGGARFPGNAVLPDGSVESGTFALIGPLSYFAAGNQAAAGLVERGAAAHPRVTVITPESVPLIAGFVARGEGPLPVDPTMGKAKAIVTSEESLAQHIRKGGFWMAPILFFGAAALVMALWKLWEISAIKRLPAPVLKQVLGLLGQGKTAEASALLREHPGPASRMLSEAMRNIALPREVLDEIMYASILEVQPKLERGLPLISVTAAVAPLLGLLGTVTGMITTFSLITLFGTGDARSLSSGISEALITTEYGLIVAIPSLLLYGYLSRRVSGTLGDMEKISVAFSNGIAALRARRPDLRLEPATAPDEPETAVATA